MPACVRHRRGTGTSAGGSSANLPGLCDTSSTLSGIPPSPGARTRSVSAAHCTQDPRFKRKAPHRTQPHSAHSKPQDPRQAAADLRGTRRRSPWGRRCAGGRGAGSQACARGCRGMRCPRHSRATSCLAPSTRCSAATLARLRCSSHPDAQRARARALAASPRSQTARTPLRSAAPPCRHPACFGSRRRVA
eukprot:2985892-Rhodomonas_salina.2